MKKKELTEQEIAEKKAIKEINKAVRSLTSKVKKDCKENGINKYMEEL